MADATGGVGVARAVLREILGVDTRGVDAIMRTIRDMGLLPELRTASIRKRIGTRAMSLLNKSLESAAEEQTNSDEGRVKADEPDAEMDKKKKNVKKEKEGKGKAADSEKEVKESSFSFIRHLMNEEMSADSDGVMMKVKPEEIRDPVKRNQALKAQKETERLSKNPEAQKAARRRQLMDQKRKIEQELRDL